MFAVETVGVFVGSLCPAVVTILLFFLGFFFVFGVWRILCRRGTGCDSRFRPLLNVAVSRSMVVLSREGGGESSLLDIHLSVISHKTVSCRFGYVYDCVRE